MKIIAEVGSNWSTKQDCIRSIQGAKVYGADAVKFQLFDEYSFNYKPTPREGAMPLQWIPELKDFASLQGIEFMCSAFSPKLLDYVNQYVNTHKIASAEMCHIEMLDLLKIYKKPVILSTGGHSVNEVRQSIARLEGLDLTLMYCIAAYPARHTNLNKITRMKALYGLPVGLSDHSVETYSVPERAQELGSTVLEKHVNFVESVGPDSYHSLSGDEFKKMCVQLRTPQTPLDYADSEELEMITHHHRRLIATKDIKPGTALILNENFGIYRSTKYDDHGLNPFMLEFVQNKTAKKEIKAGNSLGPGDF